MKNLSKLAYKLHSMGLEKEAAEIDDLIKESSEKHKVCKSFHPNSIQVANLGS